MATLHCPNCGADLGPRLAAIRMTTCVSCGTSVILEDEAVRIAGTGGVMHDAPLLLGLGARARVAGRVWRVLGHARFSYGRGTWDEFWALPEDGLPGAWISVDEGEVVVQAPLPPEDWPKGAGEPALGAELRVRGRSFRATEVETATCEAVRGAFPEVILVGESHRFVNLSGERGDLLSGEFWPGGKAWSLGDWADPFEVEPLG